MSHPSNDQLCTHQYLPQQLILRVSSEVIDDLSEENPIHYTRCGESDEDRPKRAVDVDSQSCRRHFNRALVRS